ncbi:DUF1336 domain containing protein, expressed [Seminavis robusta]|uniref:DUF1336 domain containing protein, expressed n=1 Tax=Seminavis robusta TaxID=568900 RepID=A0A9N8H5N3_9STRA|nr:DUF1336 domain containing protein, expressed [Seminavis robusta]|eukprot:Sro90_g047440.1 DUF1336 domain containing protein, expressed (1336) ;mRNA; f:94940-98947
MEDQGGEIDSSESNNGVDSYDRPEASESGIITELEHQRSQNMANVDMSADLGIADDLEVPVQAANHTGTSKSKGKSRRLSTRVARGIKKQINSAITTSSSSSSSQHPSSGKSSRRPRSLSPPRSGRHPHSPNSSGEEAEESTSSNQQQQKQKSSKHKSSYKHVAKAAAAAAKKLKVKKSSKKSHDVEMHQNVHHAYSSSANSSRASTPTQTTTHHSTMMMMGKTPVNTPVNAATIIDGQQAINIMQQQQHQQLQPHLPPTLAECDEEGSESQFNPSESHNDPTEASMEFNLVHQKDEPFAAANNPSPAAAEDEALKLAQAMAMAVQANPTKSHQEIQRMVLSQPEFQHMAATAHPPAAAPSSSGSGSGSKGFTKNFKSLQKTIASGAKTAQKAAQKGFLEYAGTIESALGSSTTSFPFSMSTAKEPSKSNVMETGSTGTATTATTTTASTAPPPAVAMASLTPTISAATTTSNSTLPPTIKEETPSTMSLEQSHTTGVSLHSSTTSNPMAAATVATEQMEGLPKSPSFDATSAAANANNKNELPIKMTDVIWKRRSGFGSYYRSSAWERRRFILQGNALSYFRAKGENSRDDDRDVSAGGGGDLMDDATERFENDPKYYTSASGKTTSTKQRMMDALEQTATTLGLSTISTTSTGAEKIAGEIASSARGYMDLVKENAVVCATLGHSGAPSPFCLSIKVGGETKWKLCFASHRAQLMWMAAITDVIVQNSVDAYNLKLLSAADPANHDPTALFLPSLQEPPSDAEGQQPAQRDSGSQQQQLQHNSNSAFEDSENMPTPNFHHVSGRRLWMMEPYVIRAQNELTPEEHDVKEDDSADYDDEEDSDEEDDEADNLESKVPETDATVDDSDLWFMPEKRLVVAAAMINMALMYARNSTMSVQSFWMVVTVANMTLFTLLESMPRPGVASAAAKIAPSTTKPRKEKRKKPNRKKGTGSGGAGSGADKGSGAAATSTGVKAKKKKEKYVPLAGLSALRLKEHTDPRVNAKGEKFSGWMSIPGENLGVRSHGYITTKSKVPSPGSIYELVQMDIFESPARYPDMAKRVKLPKLPYDVDPNEVKTWRAPDHFVVSLSLPTDPPKLGSSSSDGGGYTVTLYFNMYKTTRDILKRITAEDYDPTSEPTPDDVQKSQVNAIRLFEDWVRRAPSDVEFQKRFKMIPNVVNAKEIGLPSWIGKYNGKPFLIKRPGQTGFLYPHPEISCVEFDISLHVFPYLAKQGICYMKDSMFANVVCSVGFVIEGRSDDELPECVIGLGQVCYPDPATMMQAADFFAGTAIRSFEPEEAEKPKPEATTEPAAAPAPAPAPSRPPATAGPSTAFDA